MSYYGHNASWDMTAYQESTERSSYIIVHLKRTICHRSMVKCPVDQATQPIDGHFCSQGQSLVPGRPRICRLRHRESERQPDVIENRTRIIPVSGINMAQPVLGEGIVVGCCSSSARRNLC